MLIKTILLLSLSMVSCHLAAKTENDYIDDVMRGIGIKYLVSEDRKLPKKDREKWESNLSEYVDFKSLNKDMRERILEAANISEHDINNEAILHLQNKAVLFLVPRELSDYMLAYLKFRDKYKTLELCTTTPKLNSEDKLYFCKKNISNTEQHLVLYKQDSSEPYARDRKSVV